MEKYHIPVLLNESIEGLNINPEGIYVDATYGGGGHSGAILNRLGAGKLIAFDQDDDAARNAVCDERLIFVRANFRYLENFLRYYGIAQVDGILADLGVSSHDFDEAGRGFSFRFDAPLDMRMNREASLTAAAILNDYSRDELFRIFTHFGEIKNAGKLVSTIVTAREQSPLKTSGDLLNAVKPCVPKAIEKKYLAQLFQALRMETNDETGALKEFLTSVPEALKPGGRIVVLSYHSIEDRLVKNFLRSGNFEGKIEKDFYGNIDVPFELINRKVIVPSDDETTANPRSRSAKLRIAEKRRA